MGTAGPSPAQNPAFLLRSVPPKTGRRCTTAPSEKGMSAQKRHPDPLGGGQCMSGAMLQAHATPFPFHCVNAAPAGTRRPRP